MKTLTFIFASLVSLVSLAQPVFLVTNDEMIRSNNNKSAFQPKFAPVPGAPVIELLTPKLDSLIVSPTPIKLRFESKAPSTVRPETFKVFYGSFQIDITERLLGASKVAHSGFNVPEAALPKGSHKLTLNIQDSEGRVGSKTVEFEVK
jgi:hypothetical protein